MIVFLPQIMLLFFALALLDESGYLARATLLMDRLMRRVGLPGRAFIPMLSAHVCAIPALMSTRVIEDRRERLVTMLILPLLTCSARVPVAMLVSLLLIRTPLLAGAVMLGCYLLGIVAALVMGFVFRKTLLKGDATPLLIELPAYRLPSPAAALRVMGERGWVFLKQAGGIILAISIVLRFAATFPQLLEDRLETFVGPERHSQLLARQEAAAEYSIAGRVGRAMEPVFTPLGFTWQMNVGVVSSFAAREVFVATMAVVYGVADAEEGQPLYDLLAKQTRADGSPALDLPTCLSLLVFFVLAIQCLPTQAVMKRETGGWRWPIFQLAYTTALAYGAALAVYQATHAFT
ncbi:MAG: nucleoside recognition domain-containing protein [Planctomycetota bacterium]